MRLTRHWNKLPGIAYKPWNNVSMTRCSLLGKRRPELAEADSYPRSAVPAADDKAELSPGVWKLLRKFWKQISRTSSRLTSLRSGENPFCHSWQTYRVPCGALQ